MTTQARRLVTRQRRMAAAPRSLTWLGLRHAAIFAVAVVAAAILDRELPIASNATLWLAIALTLGLLAGAIGGEWLGLVLLLAGLFVGGWLSIADRHGATESALPALQVAAPSYAAALLAAIAAYVVLRLVRRQLG